MNSRNEIAELLIRVAPVTPQTTISAAGDLFLQPELSQMLSLPIVEDAKLVGSISRYQLVDIFLRRFGREIHGSRRVTSMMNPKPLQVNVGQSLESAAQYVAQNLGKPITEDFVILQDGRYAGMGVVLDLLRMMEQRVALSAAHLSEAYRRLKLSQAQLVQSEKMASLGQMVAGVAHEINTPLGYVRNNVETLQSIFRQMMAVVSGAQEIGNLLASERLDDSRLQEQLVQTAATAQELNDLGVLSELDGIFRDTLFGADQIKELVVNLRNFSRLDQAKIADVNLNDCLEQSLVIANNVLKNRVEVVRRFNHLPTVRCSPSQINQVFLNLLTNAAQAIEHDQGKLILTTETEPGWVHVNVQDNGKGIPQDNLKKIFDPFFTTKPVGEGTGLGLSISFQIVQAHGGRIRVASKEGLGTRFVVSLPVEPQQTNEAMQAVAA